MLDRSPLWQARFFTTVNDLRHLPASCVPEIAFAGRSNAGKSTAINVLCNQKNLAFASKTPGRTQHINYFSLGGIQGRQHRQGNTDVDSVDAFLVDLPGYGYAQVSGSAKHHWQALLSDYIHSREQLAGLVLIVDARRLFTALDIQMVEWFAPTGKPIYCLLSKTDKLTRHEAVQAQQIAKTFLASYTNHQCQPLPYSVQLFSALKRTGVAQANDKIISMLAFKLNP